MSEAPEKPIGPVVVVGLGNPGMEYFWTPHNAGFMAIDRIAQQQGVVVQNADAPTFLGNEATKLERGKHAGNGFPADLCHGSNRGVT